MPHTVLVLGNPTDRHLRLLAELPLETSIAVGETPEAFANLAPEADIIFFANQNPPLFEQVIRMAPRVKWVHSLWAGVDKLLVPEIRDTAIPLTNAKGAYSKSLAEFCILGILFFAKDMRRLLRQQRERHWEKFACVEIHGQTLGIIGYGDIGRAIALRGHGMGLRIHALRRRPEQSQGDPIIEKTYAPDQILELMAACDYVALALPQTPDTVRTVGAREIAAMKPSAVILNVGRGSAIDEPALAEALQQNRIRGAALDVFDTEPLPASSPFWTLDNVFLSPHCADNTATWQDDSVRIFLDNFRRYAAGQPLRNIVDKESGY